MRRGYRARLQAVGLGTATVIAVIVPLQASVVQSGKPNTIGTESTTIPAKPAWKFYPPAPSAPKGAPNVVLIMTDDVGFGASSTFGGPIPTPNFDRLAATGLRYNAFHTASMCSPTRAALLTGRNHHSVGFGAISNVAADAPGYTSVIPDSAATIARVLHENGYNTAMFGKNHNTPEWEMGPLGPFDHWPNGLGFDYFYGFNAAQIDQFSPALTENRNSISPPRSPDYVLDRDLVDKMIHWISVQRAIRPDHPFFSYLAPGTMHEPQQAPPEWISKFRGKFDKGWDFVRDETFAQQVKLGIVPKDAVLTPRPYYLPAWNSLSADERKLYARMMEVAAAQLSFMDDQFGRLLDYLERTGQRNNTLIMFIQGDNGASEEYEFGETNSDLYGTGISEKPKDMFPKIDALGGPGIHGQYAPGWAWATNAPFPESKQIASHLGGLRDGFVVSWPSRIKGHGEVRTQFTHVIDVAPTIYEAIGITPPTVLDGVKQQPIEGTSMLYSFNDPKAPERHRTQYFEMLGNRGYYEDGWLASTLPPVPVFSEATRGLRPETFKWGLYNLRKDFSQSRDLSAQFPGRLKAMQAAFDAEARAHNVYPLSSDIYGRMSPEFRPKVMSGSGPRVYLEGPTRYRTSSFPALSAGWKGVAAIQLTSGTESGPIFVQGNRLAYTTLALDKGVVVFTYNPTNRPQETVSISSLMPLSVGRHEIKISTDDATPSNLTMEIDGKLVGAAKVALFSFGVTPEAFIGRALIDDKTGLQKCECAIESVTINQSKQ